MIIWLVICGALSVDFGIRISVLVMCLLGVLMRVGELRFVGSVSTLFSRVNRWRILLVALRVWVRALIILVRLKYYYINSLPKFFQSIVVLLLLVVTLFFLTDHLLFLYVMFEFSLFPTLFLILKWGYQPERLQASLYFVIYTICASLPLLLIIMRVKASVFRFCIRFIFPFNVIGEMNCSYLYFLSFVAAFLVKVPIWGVHLWLPKAHVEAPVRGSMILAGVLLKLGGYGLVKILGVIYKISRKLGNLVLGINLWGALAVSFICICVVDVKSLIAYSSIIHIGGIVVGIIRGRRLGLLGGILIMLAHGLRSPGIFAMANLNYEIRGRRNILLHKGLCAIYPVARLMWFILLSSNIAAPPSLNLAGEFLICVSVLKLGFWLFRVIGIVTFLAGAYNLYLYSSQLGNPRVIMLPSASFRSSATLAILLHCVPVYFCTLLVYLVYYDWAELAEFWFPRWDKSLIVMIIDIFSRFDDQNRVLLGLFPLVWGLVFVRSCRVLVKAWGRYRRFLGVISSVFAIGEDLVRRTQGKDLGGAACISAALMLVILVLNLMGLAPFIFSLTRHLAINLALSLPIWLRVVLMSITYDARAFLAHLQPLGAPAPLNPFLCVIELVSLLVRPITLAVRLTANLSTGHILIGLLGVGFVSQTGVGLVVILGVGLFYFIFEMAVCVIQAYIFTLLPTLYADEHPEHR